mmetsp:Transcript_16727/g.67476  ORF Transcript_16727/g.67476 Transcript_16727/m.67476 type:complete len:256 (+) Transcript_16727:588-1355(+)
MGLFLVLPSRAAHRLGVRLALALHLAIAQTPYPNQIAVYGVACARRLALCVDLEAWATARAPDAYGAVFVRRVFVGRGLVRLRRVVRDAHDKSEHRTDWAVPDYAWQCCVCLRATAIAQRAASHLREDARRPRGRAPAFFGWACVALAGFDALGENVLGLVDTLAAAPSRSFACTAARTTSSCRPRCCTNDVRPPSRSVVHGDVVRVEATNSTCTCSRCSRARRPRSSRQARSRSCERRATSGASSPRRSFGSSA